MSLLGQSFLPLRTKTSGLPLCVWLWLEEYNQGILDKATFGSSSTKGQESWWPCVTPERYLGVQPIGAAPGKAFFGSDKSEVYGTVLFKRWFPKFIKLYAENRNYFISHLKQS